MKDKPKKKRGRPAPDYGPRVCPLCGTKLTLGPVLLECKKCGWKQA